jgi:hypothetical protein
MFLFRIFVMILLAHLDLSAFISSENYRVPTLSPYNTGNSDYKVSYSYRLMGNIIPFGYSIFMGSRINVYAGLTSLSRGPEENVSKAYVYPNPCNLRYGCNGVVFTKLSVICEIRIYSISGEHIVTLNKNTNSEKYGWDLKDKNGITVPSGLYLFYIKDDKGVSKKGKVVIIR